MGNIQDLLAQILSARYGRDVRQSIHDAIETCYEDGHAGAIDLQAREDIAQANELLGNTDISGISETVTGAVVELNGAVGTAQETAEAKLSPEDALKYDRASKTFTNITIQANSDYQFPIPIPDGVTNPRPIYARSTSLSLVMTNLYVVAPNMYIYLRNTSDTPITADVTVEVTFLYN